MLHLHVSEPDDPALVGLGSALAELTPVMRRVFRRRRIPVAGRVARRRLGTPGASVLLTSPDQAALLDAYPGDARIVYYAKDNFAVGYGWPPGKVHGWESRIVDRSRHVVAVSRALSDALRERYGLPADRVSVSPNAVPAGVVPTACPAGPGTLPPSLAGASRPVAGVLGRISSRLRLDWLRIAVDETPWLHWLFAGDVERAELRVRDLTHLAWLRRHPRCHFAGRCSYEELCEYAGAVDVGVLPYGPASINPWASPMRLFLHLPFGRPLVATPGCPQLEEFEPLVALCRDAEALVTKLEALRNRAFDDGLDDERWRTARLHTWERRAAGLLARFAPHSGSVA